MTQPQIQSTLFKQEGFEGRKKDVNGSGNFQKSKKNLTLGPRLEATKDKAPDKTGVRYNYKKSNYYESCQT